MGIADKFDNMKDEKVGQAKAAYGDATDNQEIEAEGRMQQAEGGLKGAAEKVKDAFKN